MEKLKVLIERPVFRISVATILILILAGTAGGIYITQKTPNQPIAFPHSLHVGIGAQCLYCHPGAQWGPTAGLPSNSKCWGCHQQIEKQSPELEKLATYVREGKPIPWVPVAIQPDFVHFSHRPHINAGLNCETCHGDVSRMQVAQVQRGQNMGWCLNCHQRMRPSEFTRLSDCSLCHY